MEKTPFALEPTGELVSSDKIYLRKSAISITEQLLENNNGGLPDAVIYPDTTARPLHYLFNPIFESIAESRGLVVPQSFFFKVLRLDSIFVTKKIEEKGKNISEDVLREMNSILKWPMPKIVKRTLSKIVEYYEDEDWFEDVCLQEAKGLRILTDFRAVEIDNYFKKVGIYHPSIVVIDDYTNLNISLDEIRRAFNRKIPLYALMSSKNKSFQREQIAYGMIDPSTARGLTMGFEYLRDKRSTGVWKHYEDSHAQMGPRSPWSSVIPSHERTYHSMSKLRHDMQEIGEGIANELFK